tara:strand:+ start:796 stop:1533 length:738 start_codon:yes stop_codon:yes gene_type:complete
MEMNRIKTHFTSIGRTIRRYYVDEFFFNELSDIPSKSSILDLGGNKIKKRGQFNIENHSDNVTYTDISKEKKPDIQASAALLPFKPDIFDIIICAELLEHVLNPPEILTELHRIIKPNGKLFITVPFMYHIHSDPSDYGRYTDTYWRTNLTEIGFSDISIKPQGAFYSVLMELIRSFAYRFTKRRKLSWIPLNPIITLLTKIGINLSIKLDLANQNKKDDFHRKYTLGFEIIATKPEKIKLLNQI